MATIKQDRGTPWSLTGTAGTSVVLSSAGMGTQTIYVTDVAASLSLGTGTLIIKSGSSTTIHQIGIGSTTPYIQGWVEPLGCSAGTSLTITVTGNVGVICYANATGFFSNLS